MPPLLHTAGFGGGGSGPAESALLPERDDDRARLAQIPGPVDVREPGEPSWQLGTGGAEALDRHGAAAYDLGLIARFREVDYPMRRATAAAATPATRARSATVKGMTAPMKRILTAASFAALLGCAHFGKKEDEAEAAALQKQVQAQQAQINELKSQQASPLQTQINELKSQIGMLQTQLIGLQTQSNGAATSKLAPALSPPAAGPALAPPPAGTPAYAPPAAAPVAATPR